MTWLRSRQTVIILSLLTFMVMLARIFLDFRYVAVEFEAAEAVMPFTLPYTIVGALIFGGWAGALIGAHDGRRWSMVALLVFALLTLSLGASTVFYLCPTPCTSAGGMLADVTSWGGFALGALSALSLGLALWQKEPVGAVV